MVHKVLNEQEIFGLEALSACVRSDSQLSKDEAFVEERPFDSPSDEEYGEYFRILHPSIIVVFSSNHC